MGTIKTRSNDLSTLIQMQHLISKIDANMRMLGLSFEEASELAVVKVELKEVKHSPCKCKIMVDYEAKNTPAE